MASKIVTIIFLMALFGIENVQSYSEFAEPLKLAIPRADGIYEFELIITEKLTMSTDGENGKVQVLDYDPDQYQSMPWQVRDSDQEKPCEASNSWNSSYYNLTSLLQLHGLHQVVHSINGKVPGDPIVVPYGAEVILTVFNQLLSSVMTLHVHGLDKKGLWYTDGVGFLQQCPIPPQTKYQYRFIADTPGTHFFHGHIGMDKGYGILGAFIVKKEKQEKIQLQEKQIIPSREYVMMLQDWSIASSNYIWYAQRWRTMKWQWGFDLEKLGRCWSPTRTYDFGAIGGVVALRTLLVNEHGWHDQNDMLQRPETLPLETFKIRKGIRLQCKSETICTAIIYFYRLSVKTDCTKTFDKFNIARACICAAGSREGDTQSTGAEDVLNVSNKILFPEAHPVLIVDERAAGRMKEFDEVRRILTKPGWQFTGAPNAHKYLARYLSLLRDYQPRLFEQYEMEKLCTIVLQDMYICPYFIWSSTGEVISALAIHFGNYLSLLSSSAGGLLPDQADFLDHSVYHQQCENVLIRIINGASSHMMMLTIDDHKYTVVSADGYPLKAVETDLMIINPGERYDILIAGLSNPQRQSYPIIIETMEHFNKTGSIIEPFFGAAKIYYEDFGGDNSEAVLNPDWYHTHRCTSQNRCLVLNCPFKQFPQEYNFNCKYTTDFESLNRPEDPEILSSNGFETGYEEYFINMHYDSHMNGWMYQMPRGIPYFHKQNLQEFSKPCDRQACPPESDARFDDACFCFYHLNITLGNIVQLVIYNMGYGGGYTNGYAHPIHIHGTHYYLLKMEFPEYNATNFVKQPNQDIDCEQTLHCNEKSFRNSSWLNGRIPNIDTKNPTFRDTVAVPMGGYVVIRFRATNPGWWFAHCHLMLHQMAGMAFAIKVGEHHQMPIPPSGFPNSCGDFDAPPLDKSLKSGFPNFVV